MIKKYSIQDVKDIIEMEGLGYALAHYVTAERIEDMALKHAWDVAQSAIRTIESILEKHDA
ncbi:MAG: hypothetical protein ACXABY_11520 [Candidatus Thorarchaeota archaeon]|jgi:hypothetical protein